MTDRIRKGDRPASPVGGCSAEREPTGDFTLNAEVHRICIAEGGYPAKWPRHMCCPCCGTGQLKSLFTKHQFNHRQCKNCGFVCIDPYPPEDIVKRLYAGSYYTNFREFYEARHLRKVGGYSMTAAPIELLEKERRGGASAPAKAGDWVEVGAGREPTLSMRAVAAPSRCH